MNIRRVCISIIFLLSMSLCAQKKNGPSIIWVNKPTKALPSGVTHKTFKSKAANKDIGYCIYLPPSYESNKDKKYPVIYTLHGNGGNEFRVVDDAGLLDEGIKKGWWPEMIMVFPNGGHSTFYKDSYDGKFPMETIFMKELIPYIDANFRTIAEKKGRCIEGFSMGGRGSTRLAVKYPEMFCSLFCQAGNVPHTADAFNPEEKDKHPNSYLGPDKQNYIDNDVYLLLEKNVNKIKSGKLRINIACGTKDPGHLGTVRQFHQKLLDLKIDHTYLEIEGLAHKRTQMRNMSKKTWFDYHVESLRRSGGLSKK